ncbi:hypothetical protein [Rhodospirillum sp. A1_3_36]|uniref:hypothetical protein n=1 Tax=Rhodospirillum sp. A1_3_36 TaxID=3391666 RepID=UPI0039A72547
MAFDENAAGHILKSYKCLVGELIPNQAVTFSDQPSTTGAQGSQCIMDYWEGYEAMSKIETFGASLDIGIKGVLGLDVGYQETVAQKTTNHSVVLYIDSRVKRFVTEGGAVKWRDDTVRPTPGDLNSYIRFYTKYGDRFVSSVTTGARYALALVYFATTHDEAQEVKANLGLSANIKGIPVTTEIRNDLAKGMEKINVACQLRVVADGLADFKGGVPSVDDPPTRHIDFAMGILTQELPKPAVVDLKLTSYNVVPDDEQVFYQVDQNIDRFEKVRDDAFQIRALYKHVKWISLIYRYFGNAPDPKLDTVGKEAELDMKALRGALLSYEESPARKLGDLPELKSLRHGVPELNVQDWESPLYGTDDGRKKYDLMSGPDWKVNPWRIATVRISRWADYVGDIEIKYERLYLTNVGLIQGYLSASEIGWFSLRNRGDDDGFFLGPAVTPSSDAYVKFMKLRCGAGLDYIAFKFSDNIEASGGGDGGGEVHLEEQRTCVTGFRSSTEPYAALFGLKILGKTFLPTHWV